MSKTAVVYWSGTGNTEAMAAKVVEGAQAAGAEVSLFTAAEFGADKMDEFDSVAFGCPSMGSEQLEEDEFEPMFLSCEAKLRGGLSERQEDRSVRLLWLGRRRVDENLGGDLPGGWRCTGLRLRDLQ